MHSPLLLEGEAVRLSTICHAVCTGIARRRGMMAEKRAWRTRAKGHPVNSFGGLLGVALWCCSCAAWAEDRAAGEAPRAAAGYKSCAQLTRMVVARVGLKYRPNIYSDCRRWPEDHAYSLVAVGGPCYEPRDRGTDPWYCDLNVVLVDSRRGRTLKSVFEPDSITSDAMRFSGLRLDMAPYHLAPGVRAFGVRLRGEGVTSASNELLNLYVEQGSGLRKVLDGLTVRIGASGNYDITTLAIGGTAHHGLADLRVTTISRHSEGKAKEISSYVTTYIYDGRLYKEEKAFSPATAGALEGR